MIITTLQLVVSNSVNVQVKRLEYISTFLGGDYNKGKQLYVEITPLHLHRLAFICLRLGFRFHTCFLNRKQLLLSEQNGYKNTVFIKGGALKNNTEKSHGFL
jgi:hypothetical protein